MNDKLNTRALKHFLILKGQCLTMISSSRSGDSTRGMITWFRNSGVFSCFSTLFKVFSCPESNAKLSRTEGLEKQIKKTEQGKGMPQRAFLSSSLKWLRSEEITLLVFKSVYFRQLAVKSSAEYAGMDEPQSLLEMVQMHQIPQNILLNYKHTTESGSCLGISVTYTEAILSSSLPLPVKFWSKV